MAAFSIRAIWFDYLRNATKILNMPNDFDAFIERAPKTVAFLSKKTFFDKGYQANSVEAHVITDALAAINYATSQDDDEREEWSRLGELAYSDAAFDSPRWLRSKLFDYVSERLDEADLNDVENKVSFIRDNMVEDLIYCLENEAYGSPIVFFEKMLNAYEQGGWPCGWLGKHPEGKMIVLDPNPK